MQKFAQNMGFRGYFRIWLNGVSWYFNSNFLSFGHGIRFCGDDSPDLDEQWNPSFVIAPPINFNLDEIMVKNVFQHMAIINGNT